MNQKVRNNIEKKLAQDNMCYVLITCAKPGVDGNMSVEMTYGGGDALLASYLIQGAQNVMDETIMEQSQRQDTSLRLVK